MPPTGFHDWTHKADQGEQESGGEENEQEDEDATSFVQTKMKSKSKSSQHAAAKVSAFVRKFARKHKSTALAELAVHIAAVVRGKGDAFAKVCRFV